MAARDIEALLRERMLHYDPNADVSPGSPFDIQVVQPLSRRLGTDPFTVDLSTFLSARMGQAFPEIATQDGDVVSDLLIKPATLMWDPIVREINKVKQNLSFQDPTQLTTEEADALGANLFESRRRGGLARGPARILFTSPQKADVSPANFFTSRAGLHFFPTEAQSIRTEEMILNITEDNLYYFDVNVIAEAPGVEYNIGPDELVSVANLPSATRVTNTRRFRLGETEENAQAFHSRARQNFSERSLVTLRGTSAKLVRSFPELKRLNVVGFNDPEMQRDIVRGGGLGSIVASGNAGVVISDGEGQALQRRFFTAEEDFLTILGERRDSLMLTLFDAFGSTVVAQDLDVLRVVSANEIDVVEQVLALGSTNVRWTLRRKELTLSHIPGGILFPNTAHGELAVRSDELHIGGMVDTYVRGSGFQEEAFLLQNITDDEPLLTGTDATVVTTGLGNVIQLNSLVLGTNFTAGDATYAKLERSARYGYSLQLQDPPEAGNYRVLSWTTDGGGVVQVQVTPAPISPTLLNSRWRLFDEINIDLLQPKETKVTGTTLQTLQNSDVLSVGVGADLIALGVAEGDTIEILNGLSAGQYNIVEPPLAPSQVRVSVVMPRTETALSYKIYRAGASGLVPPFVRITKVELLDSSGQPVGTTVPYACPVDAQSRAFQNPARGVKHDLIAAELGILTQPAPYNVGSGTLEVYVAGAAVPTQTLNIVTGAGIPAVVMRDSLNAAFLAAYGFPEVATIIGDDRIGLRPVGARGVVAIIGGGARAALFGDTQLRTSGDVRDAGISSWTALNPAIDLELGLDALQTLDGVDVGFYPAPFTANLILPVAAPAATTSTALLVGAIPSTAATPEDAFAELQAAFAPAERKRVQIGARSVGSARVFFLEPTSFEVDADSRFTLETPTGTLRFLPDPTMRLQQLPSLPSNTPIMDGSAATGGASFSSASQDFLLSAIRPGDELVIETIPIEGTIVIPDPLPAAAGLTLVFSLGDTTPRTVVFLRDDASLAVGEVSRDGIIEQINSIVGEDLASLTGDNRIRLRSHKLFTLYGGTAVNVVLGQVANTSPVLSFDPGVTNGSPQRGTYVVDTVQQTSLGLEALLPSTAPFPSPLTEQSFKVYRSGVQRISSSQMAENTSEAGLYHADIELLSEGVGDLWNIPAGQQLVPSGYRSDGYRLVTDDPNLTFSQLERPKLILSRTVLPQGVDDDPSNAQQLTGESLEVTYDRIALVADVQGYIASETERTVCSNPLARHLIPYFVRYDMLYSGGSREDLVKARSERYIDDLSPVETLSVAALQKLATDLGASYVRNPMDLIAVVHRIDRTVWISRSQDQLALDDRLSAFIPELLNITRQAS